MTLLEGRPSWVVRRLTTRDATSFADVVFDREDRATRWRAGIRLHDLFAARVRATPSTVALDFGGDAWTFGALEQLATAIAE